LALRESVLGPGHPSTAATLNNLARVYQMQGRYQEAEPLYHRALSIREQMLSPEHPHVARTLHELGLLYKLQGQDTEAEPLFQRALAIREQCLGAEHPETVATRTTYAALLEQKKTGRGRLVDS